MAKNELDQLYIVNPTDQAFTVKWGGVSYTLQPGEKKIWMRFLAEHFAKHLTDAILMGMEQRHKKDYLAKGGSERDYIPKSYLNNRVMRPQTIDSILTGVYSYHQGVEQDPNAMIQAQIDQLNPNKPKERELDLGEAADPLYGVLKDDSKAPQMTAPTMTVPLQTPADQQTTQAPQMAQGAEMMPTEPMNAPQLIPDDFPQGTDPSMKDLRIEAEKLGITVPFGATKDALKELIRKQYA